MLIGRGVETAALDRLLGDAEAGRGSAVVVRGEAGAGKSTLLDYARTARPGFVVLDAVGIESEAELAFAGLDQLLHPLYDRLDAIPAPQSAALRAAFGLSDETVAERFRISLGALALLAAAAEEGPVLCVVDDAQWLDEASAAALLFVARRLEAERVAVLFAARDGTTRPFVAPGLPDLFVGPLPDADARELAVRRLGEVASSEAVEWVLAHADGNPLALVELPGALTSAHVSGREPVTGLMPPATSVERAYLDRVTQLPTAVREWLVVVAAEESGDRGTISRAATTLGLSSAALAEAEASGLVSVDADRISFRHPLVRSAVYRGAPFTEREGAHRVLADVFAETGDLDRRAWHLALSTSGTDDAVAADLEATADRAQLRAGYAGAATAFERSASLSSQVTDRTRRTVRAARAAWQAGQRERAVALLDSVSRLVAEPAERAERDHVRGLIELSCGSQQTASVLLIAGADDIAARDPAMAIDMLLDAGLAGGRSGDPDVFADAGQRAESLPAPDEVHELLRDLLIGVGALSVQQSVAEIDRLRDAIARAQHHADPRLLGWAAFGAAVVGAPGTAAALSRTVEAAREFGAVPVVVLIQESLLVASHIAGRYSFEAEAQEGRQLAAEAGLTTTATAFGAFLGWVAALRGDADACNRHATDVATEASNGMAMANSTAQWAVALLDLSLGRPEQAAARLLALRAAGVGAAHPLFVLMSTGDLVEACVQAGRLDEARPALEALREYARPKAPVWAHALVARCQALLLDGEAAVEQFETALQLLAAVDRPFDAARTRLAYGSFLRRQRRRADARDHLRAAVETFERIDAEPWSERARVELRATGETARKRDPSTFSQLTPQETQIARLVGDGKSNKDVAAQLFLSPRTVEYHLAKVFAKLGITSRAELIRQRAALEPAG